MTLGDDPGRGVINRPHPNMTQYTPEEVAQHASQGDCWVILLGEVYDVTDFLSEHPGGVAALSKAGRAGTDVTPHFLRIGHSAHARSHRISSQRSQFRFRAKLYLKCRSMSVPKQPW